jgi:Fe-S-cluster containining protein
MSAAPDASSEAWYRDGLRFACTRCGNCCTGEPGSVRVDAREVAELARLRGLDVDRFRVLYTRRLDDGATSLRERPNGDCVFNDQRAGCTVYEHRPRQCRTWPFWRAVVRTPATWAAAGRTCPGIGAGPLHGAEGIRASTLREGTSHGASG